jgi:hypothetical protein
MTHGQIIRDDPKGTHKVINQAWKEGMTSDTISYLIQSLAQAYPSHVDHTGKWNPINCPACSMNVPLTQLHMLECTGCADITNAAELETYNTLSTSATSNHPLDDYVLPATDIAEMAPNVTDTLCPQGRFTSSYPQQEPEPPIIATVSTAVITNLVNQKEHYHRLSFWQTHDKSENIKTETKISAPNKNTTQLDQTHWTAQFATGQWIAAKNEWEGHDGIAIGAILQIHKGNNEVTGPPTGHIRISWMEPVSPRDPEQAWSDPGTWVVDITDPTQIIDRVYWQPLPTTTDTPQWGPLGTQWHTLSSKHNGHSSSIEKDRDADSTKVRTTCKGTETMHGYTYTPMHWTFQPLKFDTATLGVHYNSPIPILADEPISPYGSTGKYTYLSPRPIHKQDGALTLTTERHQDGSTKRTYILTPQMTPVPGQGISQLMRILRCPGTNAKLVRNPVGTPT